MNPKIEDRKCDKCEKSAAFQNIDGSFCTNHWMFYPNPQQKNDGFIAAYGGIKKLPTP